MSDEPLREVIRSATAADGVAPLNEAAMYALQDPSSVRQEFAHLEDRLVGYAQVDSDGQGWCVVAPGYRRRGIGTELLHRFDDIDGLHLWAHGDLPGARPLGAAVGLYPRRVLLRLERLMGAPISEGAAPEGITIRTFEPGKDDAAFLDLNARAFANHPEQGKMTQSDLEQRMASDWFDAAGFFLAERDGQLLGFHWTKTHTDPPVAEVYVVGVAPVAQGLGLGRLLTAHGLRHLQSRGFERVILYVEGDNERALGVYEGLGFTEAMRDVQYRRIQ